MSPIPIPIRTPAEQPRPSGDQGRARPDAQDASRRAQAFDEAVAEARRADPRAGSDSTPGSRRALGRTPLDDRRPASAVSSGGREAGAASIQTHPQASEIAAGGMPAWAPPNGSPAWNALHGVGVDRLGARPDGGCGVAKPRDAWPDGSGAAFGPSANPPLAKKDPTSEPLGFNVVRAEAHLAPPPAGRFPLAADPAGQGANAFASALAAPRAAQGAAGRPGGVALPMREPAPFSFGALNPTPPERIETPEAWAGDAGTGEGGSANPVSQRAGARTADRSAVGDTALRQSDPPSVRAVHADDAAPERLTDGDDAARTAGASDAAEAVRHDEGPTGTPPAPARQVANAILKAAPFAEAASTSPDTGGLARRTAQPVSYLHIVLEPPGLGSVSVRLHVSDRRLHVEMQATEPRTRALIEADAAIIAGSLAEGGYDIERIAVMAAPGDPSSPSQSEGAGTPGTGQGASDRAFQSGSSDQGRQERPREQALHNQGSRTHHDGAADHRLSHRSADGLYV